MTARRWSDAHPARPVVLHVAFNLGGGVATAIQDYAEAAPQFEHHLLCSLETGYQPTTRIDGFASITQVPRSALPATSAIRRRVRDLDAAVVHAHSSFAGAYARPLLAARRAAPPLVYTPHCFAFFRTDIPAWRARTYHRVERLLAPFTTVTAACSPAEAAAAARMRTRRTEFLPNRVPAQAVPHQGRRRTGTPFTVVAAGRLCSQKEPQLFVEAAVRSRQEGRDVRWLWVGGGEERYESLFRDNGVPFTGWLSRPEVLRRVSTGDVYVHTAAWEGTPLTILEAVGLGLPALIRDVPSLSGLAAGRSWSTVDDLLVLVDEHRERSDAAAVDEVRRAVLRTHSRDAQADALRWIYDSALWQVQSPRDERSVGAGDADSTDAVPHP